MPPRPGGVAMATMVSSGANMRLATGRARALRYVPAIVAAEMITVFMNASPMLSELTVGILGDRHVHDAALVGVQRAHLLRRAAHCAPSPP